MMSNRRKISDIQLTTFKVDQANKLQNKTFETFREHYELIDTQRIRIVELERYCHLFDPVRIQDQISETLKNTGLSRHQLGKLQEYEEELYPELSQKLFDT